jgi:hypothetical protein
MPETIEPKRPDPRQFYVVWSPQCGPPVVRYPTFGAARTAAVRLTPEVSRARFLRPRLVLGKNRHAGRRGRGRGFRYARARGYPMKLPRPRFTVRRLMVAVAIISVFDDDMKGWPCA